MLNKTWILHSVAIATLLLLTNGDTSGPPACEIFCRGKLLKVVQEAQIFPDCKHFLDMKMKIPKEKIRARFDELMNETEGKPNKVAVRRFVRNFFSSPGRELIRETPIDWVARPKFIKKVTNFYLREWAEELVFLWKRFGRKVSIDVRKNPDLYSLIYVPNLIFVPSGTNREYYYWDSYWIILGLLRSDMYQTAKGMIINYLILTEKYGYVPNGGRIYYLTRSNLPLLIPMVNEYYKFTNDTAFIIKNIEILEKEFDFWLSRLVDVQGIPLTLATYMVKSDEPRPEEYTTDTKTASRIKSKTSKSELFRNLIAACESGWNFSSRWFVLKNQKQRKLAYTKTSSIIPVDLNAVLCWNARILAQFFTMLEIPDKASTYDDIASKFQASVNDLMWDEEDGIWYDYDIPSKQRRKIFFASNFVPLWTGCYDMKKKYSIGSKVTKYLKKNKIHRYKGGIPASLIQTNFSWDFPNAMPSMQYIIIAGLRLTENKDARDLAFKLAKNWLQSTYTGFLLHKAMFDKYDAERCGIFGRDTQTIAQDLYGVTYSVCLELISIYDNDMYVEPLMSRGFCHFGSQIIFEAMFVTLMLCF